MTDRELLELAAKAAGVDLYGMEYMEDNYFYGDSRQWAPLTDDGAALRLAVKLGLDITFGNGYYFDEGDMTFCGESWDSRESCNFKRFVKHNGDPYAATRRAIVRAAARIGEKTP